MLAEGDVETDVDADGDVEAGPEDAVDAEADAEADAVFSAGALATMLGRGCSPSASPLPFLSNSPPANAAVPTTAATAAPTASAPKGRRRRG